MFSSYRPQEIEPRWQIEWENQGLYRTQEPSNKPKYYCLDFFPYPSGEGLHVGHCRNYVPTDVIARYRRLCGYNVLHPMGWDAFGEPTEMHAVAFGAHPRQTTDRNTANFRRQLRLIGTSYDWTREIDSSQPEYYRWTQEFFLLLFRKNLVYRDVNWQWWCPICQTTLSSHEAVGGVCWRGHSGLERRKIPAWYFRITAYADRLLEGLDRIDWPESVKAMQRNWIGRSEGVEIVFKAVQPVEGGDHIAAFTTRPDTVCGVSFVALAPENPLVERFTIPERQADIQSYIARAARRSELDRVSKVQESTGVFTGSWVINPVNGEPVPVWVADYVLMNYGTGAVMGVPAHDKRDFAFARKFDLPIKIVITLDGSSEDAFVDEIDVYEGPGKLIHSGKFDDLDNVQGAIHIADWLEEHDLGVRKTLYHMRDWLISRQRYWGTPIPIVHCERCGSVPVREDQLPVMLPEMEEFQPDGSGRSPLARAPEFVHTYCPQCGAPAERETDTMGGFACSSWYFLRFTSPQEKDRPFDPAAVDYWMPVDMYVGGTEHAVLHLLYARFWLKVLYDAGIVPFDEPFSRLRNQGQMLGADGVRMSKSRGNVITPDEVVNTYGADALRIYGLFMAPFDQDIAWSTAGIQGSRRFLNKVWRLYQETYNESKTCSDDDPLLEQHLHRTIRQVEERIEGLRFNTMISALMEFVNLLVERKQAGIWRTASFHKSLETLLVLLAPAAPHITEELWRQTGHLGSIHHQKWPTWDHKMAHNDRTEIVIQVDGRMREVISVDVDMPDSEVCAIALRSAKIQGFLVNRSIVRHVYVPGRVFNIITEQ